MSYWWNYWFFPESMDYINFYFFSFRLVIEKETSPNYVFRSLHLLCYKELKEKGAFSYFKKTSLIWLCNHSTSLLSFSDLGACYTLAKWISTPGSNFNLWLFIYIYLFIFWDTRVFHLGLKIEKNSPPGVKQISGPCYIKLNLSYNTV